MLDKIAFVVNFLDRDMLRALTFTDIVGTSRLGMKEGAKYFVLKTDREPDLEKLQPDQNIEIVTHIEPADIRAYITKRNASFKKSKTAGDAKEFRETLIHKGIIGPNTLNDLFLQLEQALLHE